MSGEYAWIMLYLVEELSCVLSATQDENTADVKISNSHHLLAHLPLVIDSHADVDVESWKIAQKLFRLPVQV